MKQHEAGAVGGGVEDQNKDSWEKWTEETKAAIEFEEDPHRAAMFDNPKLVYVGKKTWAALIVRLAPTLLIPQPRLLTWVAFSLGTRNLPRGTHWADICHFECDPGRGHGGSWRPKLDTLGGRRVVGSQCVNSGSRRIPERHIWQA